MLGWKLPHQADASVDPLQDGDSVTDVFNFTVTDGFGRTETTTLTINAGTDDAPVITGASALGTPRKTPGRLSASMAGSRPAT